MRDATGTGRAGAAGGALPPPGIALRVMERADIDAAERLREAAGWNQTPADWARLRAWAPRGCFVAEVGGRVVGTVTTTRHGPRLAWIGMLLVDRALRRHGVGGALLGHALRHLDRADAIRTVALDATPLGRPLYERAGFAAVWPLRRWAAVAPPVARPPGVRPARAADLAALAALDRPVFGADRRRVLRALLAAHPAGGFVLDGPEPRGYVLSRPGAGGWYVGPLVATSAAAAQRLLRAALHPLPGEPVILDAPDPNPAAAALLDALGFAPQRPLFRMRRGAATLPDPTPRHFAIAGPEIGSGAPRSSRCRGTPPDGGRGWARVDATRCLEASSRAMASRPRVAGTSAPRPVSFENCIRRLFSL